MPSFANPNHAPVAQQFFVISVSCSTSTSAIAAGIGPFRGIFVKTTTSVNITGIDGNTLTASDVQPNTILWISGVFLSAISTATAQYGLR